MVLQYKALSRKDLLDERMSAIKRPLHQSMSNNQSGPYLPAPSLCDHLYEMSEISFSALKGSISLSHHGPPAHYVPDFPYRCI